MPAAPAISPLAAEVAAGDLLSLPDLARRVGLHPSAVFRWAQRGFSDGAGGRIRLECLRRGRCWITSQAAYVRFLARHPHNTAEPTSPAPRSPAERRKGHADAMARLRARGIA